MLFQYSWNSLLCHSVGREWRMFLLPQGTWQRTFENHWSTGSSSQNPIACICWWQTGWSKATVSRYQCTAENSSLSQFSKLVLWQCQSLTAGCVAAGSPTTLPFNKKTSFSSQHLCQIFWLHGKFPWRVCNQCAKHPSRLAAVLITLIASSIPVQIPLKWWRPTITSQYFQMQLSSRLLWDVKELPHRFCEWYSFYELGIWKSDPGEI